jgi:hypothetical protein
MSPTPQCGEKEHKLACLAFQELPLYQPVLLQAHGKCSLLSHLVVAVWQAMLLLSIYIVFPASKLQRQNIVARLHAYLVLPML